jgi:hypothetical protein
MGDSKHWFVAWAYHIQRELELMGRLSTEIYGFDCGQQGIGVRIVVDGYSWGHRQMRRMETA